MQRRHISRIIAWSLVAIAIACMAYGIHLKRPDISAFAIPPTIMAFILWRFGYATLRPTRTTGYIWWLSGASRKFLDQLPPFPK